MYRSYGLAEKLKKFNWVMFAAMLALVAIGTVAIKSAGGARAEALFHGMWIGNLSAAGVGLVLYLAIAFTDYRKYLDMAAWPLYAAAIVMLVAVLLLGSTVYGGRRWLWFFQPSEVSKLCVIILLASLLGGEGSRFARFKNSFWGFLSVGGLIALPCLLILAEPDLGTTLTLVPATLLMMFVARVWRKGLLAMSVALFVVAAAILGAVYEAERPGAPADRREMILKALPLRGHQVKRIKVFLFPEEDVMGSGYNLRQAKISIGSGGYSGKGIGKGESNLLKYLPPAISMNDFIFCVYAEETGFVGSMVLLSLFAALLLPCCWIAFRTTDGRGRLLALGVSTLVFAHMYVNIAMSIGLLPITGLPLPFISAGKTFLVVVMCGLGLVQSVSVHRPSETRAGRELE